MKVMLSFLGDAHIYTAQVRAFRRFGPEQMRRPPRRSYWYSYVH